MSIDAANKLKTASIVRDNGLAPIFVATLSAAENLDFQLYTGGGWDSRPRLYRDRNYPLRQEDIDRLLERGVKVLYVPSKEHAQ